MVETPMISSSNYSNATYDINRLEKGDALQALAAAATRVPRRTQVIDNPQQMLFQQMGAAQPPKENANMATLRVVQVIIVDPHDSLPLEDRMVYSGPQQLTDLTDQELFFELDTKSLLAKHNAKRVTFPDKQFKNVDKVVMMEPVKIKDLKMNVAVVAEFK